jgi:orotidine-5'-phosphate decarboxylase
MQTKKELKKKVCLALDVDSSEEALRLVSIMKEHVGVFKVGSHLFTKLGPKIIEDVMKLGGEVFLDLKYHDIPNTVANAVRMATRMGAYIVNIHASGGLDMMRAAVEAATSEANDQQIRKPILLAVTVLTSLTDRILSEELRIKHDVLSQVVHLAELAKSAGIDGCVASPKEILAIRKACGNDFIILTPGIRPAWAAEKDDQRRITTPSEAVNNGADYIVIGRPLINAANPAEAAKKVVEELFQARI